MGFIRYLVGHGEPLSLQANNIQVLETRLVPTFSNASANIFCDPQSESYGSCHSLMRVAIQDIKRAEFYRQAFILHDKIGEVLGQRNWMGSTVEGHSGLYYDKTCRLQQAADDKRVQTICEIGFNAGYSALNFLLSNPAAEFVTFDTFQHHYSYAAASSLHSLFPDRTILPIVGLSSQTVKQFAKLNPGFRCNLILIDGSHDGPNLLADIENMRLLADPTFHRVIIDDVELPESIESWNSFIKNSNSKFKVLDYVMDVEFTSLNVTRQKLGYYFDISKPDEGLESIMVIGEYVLESRNQEKSIEYSDILIPK